MKMKQVTHRLSFALALTLGIAGVAHATDDTWLEAPHGEKALAWAQTNTQTTETQLQALPLHAVVASELTAALKGGAAEPQITLMGERAVRFLRNAEHPYGQLQVAKRDANGVPGSWNTVLDVAQLRKQEGIPFELQAYLDGACLAPAYQRCLLRLSPGGGDEVEIREFDLESGAFVANGFQVGKSRAFAEWIDEDHVLVEHTLGNAPKTIAGWPAAVRMWKRGQAATDAPVVYQAEPTDAIVQLGAVGHGAARRGVVVRAIDYSTFEVYLVDRDGKVESTPLPRTLKPMGLLATDAQHLVVQLGEDARIEGRDYPAETLLAYAADPNVPADNRLSVIYTPGEGDYLGGRGDIAASHDQVAFVLNRKLVQRVMVATPEAGGWSVREMLKAEPGDTVTLASSVDTSGDLLLMTSGFTTPKRQELYRPGQSPRLLAQDPVMYDMASYTTEIGSATSKDGTEIDYYLLKPRVPQRSGAQPTLMTGYGAFGISVRPGYFDHGVGGPSFKLWLDRGGSLVIPAIRGGGERGEAWHQAAIREKRQNSYDDFIAVAEKLVKTGYTQPSMIGVFGMSNGGLLTATLGTQRPDLFGAVVSDVPLTDMLRMKYMGMGAAWLNEYGDPENPQQTKAMLGYSPVHNIRKGTTYPPFLVTISTEDNRVGPGHARKLASRLAAVGAPVYFLEDQEGGHGVSDPFRNPGLMGLRMTFLISNLIPAE